MPLKGSELHSEWAGEDEGCLYIWIFLFLLIFFFVFFLFCLCCAAVVGRPIKCPKTAEDGLTKELVEKYHQRYVAELLRLFDEHKGRCGRAHAQLELL